jgi:hypothetical protein
MGLLKRIFGGRWGGSKPGRPTGRIEVLKQYEGGKNHLRVRVLDGLMYPGYRVSKKERVPIRRLMMKDREVDFAVEGDIVDVILDGELDAETGDTLEVYIV